MRDKVAGSFVLAVFLASIAVVFSASILGRSYLRGHTQGQLISVVGSARKSIRSDFIIWDGVVTQSSPKVASGYNALRAGVAKVKSYLVGKGIAPSEIMPQSIKVVTIYGKSQTVQNNAANAINAVNSDNSSTYRPVVGYQLSEIVEVRSHAIDKVDAVSRQATDLISQGINFQSDDPMYLYTKLSDLKVSMQAEAAADARARAQQIAASSDCRLGKLRFARMQTPQITPLYSNSGDNGVDDTTSLDKKITAIVVAGYAIS